MPGRPDNMDDPFEEPFEPPAPEQIWPPPPSELAQLTLRGIEDADRVETDEESHADRWEERSERIDHSIADIRRAASRHPLPDLPDMPSEYVYPNQSEVPASEEPYEDPAVVRSDIESPSDYDEPQQAIRLQTTDESAADFDEDEYPPEALVDVPASSPDQIDRIVAGTTTGQRVFADPTDTPKSSTAATCRIREESEGELARLWNNVFFSTEHASPQAVMVTAVRRGDGATQIAASLALFGAKASARLRIALIDLNLRQPALAEVLGIRGQPGVTDILHGAVTLDDALQRVRLDNGNVLHVLASGAPADQALGLIRSRQLQSLIGEFRERFDHIVFDVASPAVFPDAQVVGPLADGAVLVLRGGSTPREAATKAKKRLALADVRCLGLVLNQHSERALIAW